MPHETYELIAPMVSSLREVLTSHGVEFTDSMTVSTRFELEATIESEGLPVHGDAVALLEHSWTSSELLAPYLFLWNIPYALREWHLRVQDQPGDIRLLMDECFPIGQVGPDELDYNDAVPHGPLCLFLWGDTREDVGAGLISELLETSIRRIETGIYVVDGNRLCYSNEEDNALPIAGDSWRFD